MRWRGPRSAWSAVTTPRWPRASTRSSRGSSRSRSGLAALAVDLHRDGDAREHDDGDHNRVHVLGDVGHGAAEGEATQAHGGDPADAAHHVVGEEAAILHGAHPGQYGGEGADDGHEAGDDDGLGAVLLVEVPGALHVLGIEEERFLADEDARTQSGPDGVAHAVPDDGGGHEEHVDPPDIEMAGRREQPRGDEQRIAGEEAADEEARLREDDGDKEDIAAPLDERVERVVAGQDGYEEVHSRAR